MYIGLANVLIASFTTFRIPACEQLDEMAVGTKNNKIKTITYALNITKPFPATSMATYLSSMISYVRKIGRNSEVSITDMNLKAVEI